MTVSEFKLARSYCPAKVQNHVIYSNAWLYPLVENTNLAAPPVNLKQRT
jgi:hypothetical protein